MSVPGGAPASARASPSSAETSRSQTRSRSSPVAIRVNVTSRRRSSGVPSATYRVASAAIVYVLPVPALASSTVTPDGSGPQTSNGATLVSRSLTGPSAPR